MNPFDMLGGDLSKMMEQLSGQLGGEDVEGLDLEALAQQFGGAGAESFDPDALAAQFGGQEVSGLDNQIAPEDIQRVRQAVLRLPPAATVRRAGALQVPRSPEIPAGSARRREPPRSDPPVRLPDRSDRLSAFHTLLFGYLDLKYIAFIEYIAMLILRGIFR
jgi:hypothetical protein